MTVTTYWISYYPPRRKSGTKDWVQCNDAPVKVCKLPVHGLTEGASYHFRVRAVNSAGISLPSRMSSGVTAAELESDVEGKTKENFKKSHWTAKSFPCIQIKEYAYLSNRKGMS